MTLTASDVVSLSRALSWWERGEYISTAFVVVACAGEYVAEFTNWFTSGDQERKDRLNRGSTLLLIAALAVELLCLVKTNQISGRVIGSLNELAQSASSAAENALSDSKMAVAKSGNATKAASSAEGTSENALAESKKATGSASAAFNLASGARREADSFEQKIAIAERDATKAEADLVEAMKQAREAETELTLLKSQRMLTDVDGIVNALGAFADTKYTFSAVATDSDSTGLLKIIDSLLQRSHWQRVKPPPGFPAIGVFGSEDPTFAVVEAITDGLHIAVDSSVSFSRLQTLPKDQWPRCIQAAMVLNSVLALHLYPPQGDPHNPDKVTLGGDGSNEVRIFVGHKALTN